MILFFDTDILIDIALDRKPFIDDAAKLIDAAENRRFETMTGFSVMRRASLAEAIV